MQKKENNENIRRLGLKLLLVLFDVFAVNFSYFMALVLRFYVNGEFHIAGTLFMPLFLKFAPWYTICCIVVFWLFKLYSGMWRYAGPSDVRRIAAACFVTCLIQILGTLLFIRRMPITYYAIGAVIQFVLIAVSRLSYRLLITELPRFARRRNSLSTNVLIVGAGETARKVLRQFGGAEESPSRPVCVIDCHNRDNGLLFDGLPVLGGVESIGPAIEKYEVKSAIIADPVLPAEDREKIRSACEKNGVEVQDVSVYQGGILGFRALLEHANGPLELMLDGRAQYFDNSEQAAQAFTGRYRVKAVSAKDGRLLIELDSSQATPNSVNEAWVQEYEKATGESVSFF